MDSPSARPSSCVTFCGSTSSGRGSVFVSPFAVMTRYAGLVSKSSAAVGTPSIHHSTFAGFVTLPFLFFTAALYLSDSPAGSPFATTEYAVFPSVGTSYPRSTSVALKYSPTTSGVSHTA